MSKTHDAVAQLEGALPTLFDRMLAVLGLMRASHQEIAALHSADDTDEIDSEAVLAQVKNATSLSDQLAAAITEAKGATSAAASAVQASAPAEAPADPAPAVDTGSTAS